ncbi:putative inorganic polyphosphate/ATP-NAD kinase [Caloramator mitchellensis]|uniref:NAD kinase n=1 Tax=Caloramator mitchellensis TaxID=908809 RepID=A0A0R3JTG0_CALMK|nr:NAD(+)/NADH kinase [Caloramator mitchellensis]KRQ86822.1 putative inorganic polyphosphate/ATP-NAD kinase [Caloramator mitchellensis]
MNKYGLIVNKSKDKGLVVTKQIVDWFTKKRCNIYLEKDVANSIGFESIGLEDNELFSIADYLIVLGGDGTILSVARRQLPNQKPILGINFGHLGFITEAEKDNMYNAFEKLINNTFSIESRIMLEAKVVRDNKAIKEFVCLNDICITKGTLARIIAVKVFIDDELMETYRGDGVIFSTPTGSTAYSLSAGGPIVCPELEVIIATPVCPHSLNARSIIIGSNRELIVQIQDTNEEVFLTADGQDGFRLQKYDKIIIKQPKYRAKFIKLSNRNFFEVLRRKIKELTI